jgi:hypothetical protein
VRSHGADRHHVASSGYLTHCQLAIASTIVEGCESSTSCRDCPTEKANLNTFARLTHLEAAVTGHGLQTAMCPTVHNPTPAPQATTCRDLTSTPTASVSSRQLRAVATTCDFVCSNICARTSCTTSATTGTTHSSLLPSWSQPSALWTPLLIAAARPHTACHTRSRSD